MTRTETSPPRPATGPVRRPPRTGAELAVDTAQVLLCIAAAVLTCVPWLRAFPATVGAAPLLGAAALSVLVSVMGARLALPAAAAVSLGCLFAFTMLVVLQAPTGFAALQDGLVHGPAEVLTFALPLVSPRALLVDPVALTWLCGALASAAVIRRWATVMPHAVLLLGFGLAYAATQRAAGPDAGAARVRETLLALALLTCLLLLRAAQSRPPANEGAPPGRTLVPGAIAAVLVAAVAAAVVQAPVFGKRSTQPQRQPTVQDTTPLSPVAFIAGLRPADSSDPGVEAFTVHTSAPAPGYFDIADVDSYDGAGWSFTRTFRPSGGVVPADPDTSMHAGTVIEQTYRIAAGPLADGPWLVYQPRAERVDGLDVNVEPGSGMAVPARPLGAGTSYSVQSLVPLSTFDRIDPATTAPDTATPATDTQLPATLRETLDTIVAALTAETGTPSTSPLAFLQAVQRDFRSHYALAGTSTPGVSGSGASSPAASGASATSASPSSPGASGPGPVASSAGASQRAGGTGFSDVLASILGPQRTATPEQYATLTALLARDLGVPARVVSGFRVAPAPGSTLLAAGDHVVRTGQAWTWTEVAITGIGWVVLDSSPTTFKTPAQDQTSGAAASSSPTPAPASNALITTGNGGNAVAHRSTVPHLAARHGAGVLVVVLSATGLAVLIALAVLLFRKRVRARRRRRSGTPGDRVSGAWREAIDVLYEAGLAPAGELDALTSSEISARTRQRFDDSAATYARTIGDAAERATFQTAVLVSEDTVEEAWRAEQQLRRALAVQLSAADRARAFGRFHRQRRGPGRRPWPRPGRRQH